MKRLKHGTKIELIKVKHTARTPNTFMRKEPAPFNFSGDFPLEANSLSAYIY
jgi:hypothetical protein